MSITDPESSGVSEIIASIRSDVLWFAGPASDPPTSQVIPSPSISVGDIPQAVMDVLQSPIDFPALERAILPGDRVAVAVDATVPQVENVVLGVVKGIGLTDVEAIDVVIGDDALPGTIDSIRQTLETVPGDGINVSVHDASNRDGLRFVAADSNADPVYLNRWLVDADFVLPIVTSDVVPSNGIADVSSIYPAFADAASRYRAQSDTENGKVVESDAAVQLGVHVMLCATVNQDGAIATVSAITPGGFRQFGSIHQGSAGDSPSPALVVAVLDGDQQQQTWLAAAVAAKRAAERTESGGTILLWTEIEFPPQGWLATLATDQVLPEFDQINQPSENGLPKWDASLAIARTFQRLLADYRILLHSRVEAETIEGLGLGVIESTDELARLTAGFPSCGVLRAAQFANQVASWTDHARTHH